MAQLRALVTKSVMDDLLGHAICFDIIGVSTLEEKGDLPGCVVVTAQCEPDFFENVMKATQATYIEPDGNSQGFDYLSVVELLPDGGYLGDAVRSLAFFTDRVNGMVL